MDCCGIAYVIKPGDTLSGIAQRFLGSAREWRRIVVFNNEDVVLAHGGARITNPDNLRVGDTIRIPVPDAGPAATASAVPVAAPPVSGVPQNSLMSLRTPKFDIYAYLNVYWYLLDELPLAMIVPAVMKQVPAAATIGADATESYIRQWLVSIDRRIANNTFNIDIPDITAPKDVVLGNLRAKWVPVPLPPTTQSIINPPEKDGNLTLTGVFGTLSVTHFKLEKIKLTGWSVPVSKSLTLGTTVAPWSSIGFTGAWKTKGDFPDFDVGTTFQSANFADDWSVSYSFGIKNIKLGKNANLGLSTFGMFDNLKTQNFGLTFKAVSKN